MSKAGTWNQAADDAGNLKAEITTDMKAADGNKVVDVGATRAASVVNAGSLTIDDIVVDGKVITMTGSTGDTAVMTVGTNGVLTITTKDTAGAGANITITADGTAEVIGTTVTLNSSGGVTIDADNGTITFADGGASLGTITSAGWTGKVVGNVTGNCSGTAATVTGAAQAAITSVGTLTALTVDDVAVNGKVVTMTGSTDDTVTITAGTNGTLDITTVDTVGAAANIQITADGTAELAGTTVTIDSAGGVTIDADGGTVTFADGGASLGTITSTGWTGDVVGDLTGDVAGDLTGDVAGDLTGDVTGDLTGDVTGNLTGNVVGDLTGDIIAPTIAFEGGAGAVGTGVAPTTWRRTENGIIITETKIDLTGLNSVATQDDVIGLSAGTPVAYIGKNVVSTNGVIYKSELICLETPVGGDDDVNVVENTSAILVLGDAGGTAYGVDGGDAVAGQTVEDLVQGLHDTYYFYLTAGTGNVAGKYTAGQFIFRTYGHALLA